MSGYSNKASKQPASAFATKAASKSTPKHTVSNPPTLHSLSVRTTMILTFKTREKAGKAT